MAGDENRVGPAGQVLAASIKRVREALRLSYAELSRRLAGIGQPIPELGLRRIENCERRVDFDDLLALCVVLGISPVDLMVPGNLAEYQTYLVAPKTAGTAGNVREWVRGEALLLAVPKPEPGVYEHATLIDAIRWMPADRANRVYDRQSKRKDKEEDQT